MTFNIGNQFWNCFYCEETAYSGVMKIAYKVRNDIKLVTDYYPIECTKIENLGQYPIIYGTIGKSAVLKKLEEEGKIDLSEVKDKWEVYGFYLVERPYPGVECALVIAGSDKRGTIYGLFHLSELMGVSPLVDWSGVLPKKKSMVTLSESVNIISKVPSVQFRGIFINDEWPAFGTWSEYHFGGFNAAMYEHVFELLLRLKANYLWPAMWTAEFSLDGPGLANAELADEYGIVIGSSHHEPCMRNGEEYRHVRGKDSVYGDDWNFHRNKEGLKKFWEDGLKRNAPFDNIITIGMRGEYDTAILGREATLEDNINLLRDVISTQNQLIQENITEDLSKTERLFVLFTEVEEFYYGNETTKGLMNDPLLDGVTLMLCDDNYGNIRSLPTKEMRDHNGGFGLYYHLDFHGGAHAYDWMNTNYLPKMWEQLTMAYEFGIQKVWVANLGDISLLEYPLTYFMELAYDMESMGSGAINQTQDFTKRWIKEQFSGSFTEIDLEHIQTILDGYTKANHSRKPEIMNEKVYHSAHYYEARELYDQAETIINLTEDVKSRCPEEIIPAFYELVYYPAVASMNLHKMWIIATWNELYSRQGRIEANDLAEEIANCIETDRKLTAEYHTVGNGKFYGMGLSEHIGFTHWCEEDNKYPRMIRIEPANKPRLIVSPSNETNYTIGGTWTGNTIRISDFMQQEISWVDVDLALGSKDPIDYEIHMDCPWLTPSTWGGTVYKKEVVRFAIDRSELKGKEICEIWVNTSHAKIKLLIEAQVLEYNEYAPMTFMEANGYLCMAAEHYCGKCDVNDTGFQILSPYGRTRSGIKVLPSIESDFREREDRPYVEYRFVTETEGRYKIDYYLSPSNPPYSDYKMYLGIQMNDQEMKIENTVDDDFCHLTSCKEWMGGLRNNIRVYQSTIPCIKGMNTIKIYGISPSIVLEKLVIYRDRIKESYLGPKETYYIGKS